MKSLSKPQDFSNIINAVISFFFFLTLFNAAFILHTASPRVSIELYFKKSTKEKSLSK